MTEQRNRSEIIDYEGMQHAPENELGVVFLFGNVHRLLGFTAIDEIKPGFPDCWAWRRLTRGTERTWVEFEFRSSGFKAHVRKKQLGWLRPKKGIDVCWEHNWPECEEYAEVIDLRATVEGGPRVWIQSTRPEYQAELDLIPRNATKDWTWTVAPRRIANLDHPLRWGALRSDAVPRSSPFVRAQMQGQWDATAYWWRIYSLLVLLNPNLKKNRRFRAFAPHRFW